MTKQLIRNPKWSIFKQKEKQSKENTLSVFEGLCKYHFSILWVGSSTQKEQICSFSSMCFQVLRKKKKEALLLGGSGWKTFFFDLRAIFSWVFRLLGRQFLLLPSEKEEKKKAAENAWRKDNVLIPASANGYLSRLLLRQLMYFY